jgi:hypothetical protein
MMRDSIWLISVCLICLGVVACQQKTDLMPTPCEEGTCTYTFESGANLITLIDSNMSSVEVVAGSDLVFTYQFVGDERREVADDEYSETIWFQLPDLAVGEEVVLEGDALETAEVTFRPVCFCLSEVVPVRQGRLQAERVSADRWEVELSVQFTWWQSAQSREIRAVFERAE